MSNIKNYEAYNKDDDDENDDLEDLERSIDFQVDAYVRPGEENKVGKLDNYNNKKLEETYKNQKARIVPQKTREIKVPPPVDPNSIDALIPERVGDAIDGVFSKVDSLVDATSKLLFGSKKKKPSIVQKIPKRTVEKKSINYETILETDYTPKPEVQTVSRNYRKSDSENKIEKTQINNVVQKESKPKKDLKYKQRRENAFKSANEEKIKKRVKKTIAPETQIPVRKVVKKEDGPFITSTTPISELDLPLTVLNDPDLVKYFDQMKLFDKKVKGGLANKSFQKTESFLGKGRWGKRFMVEFQFLKINTMMASGDAAKNRFEGMKPVYKAMGASFTNTEELKKYITEDINLYLKTGQTHEKFHKFTYKMFRRKK